MTTPIGLVWAESARGVIGAQGGMPWHVPEDLAHFKDVTTGDPVIMGRRTWESLPGRFRPLPGRRNIVVTRSSAWESDGAERAASLDAALALAGTPPGEGASAPESIWIIGGGELFREAIARAARLEVTELDLDVAGDTFAPPREGWRVVSQEPAEGFATSRTGIRYRFLRLERPA